MTSSETSSRRLPALLAVAQKATSDEIIAAGEGLREAHWQLLGAASYCLDERREPDDVSADIAEPDRRGRRNIRAR